MRVAVLPDWRKSNPYQRLLAEALEAQGVACFFPQGYRRGLPISRALLPKPRPDVLHLHWPTPYLRDPRLFWRGLYSARTIADLAIVRVAGIPIVWTVHNLITHDAKSPKLEWWFSRRLARQVDSLIVHSEAARDAVVKELGVAPEKTSVIPHGPLADAYGAAPDRNEARDALGLPRDVPVALFFGMIRPYKGVPELLRAWDALGARRGDAVLRIVGSALDPQYAAQIADLAAEIPSVQVDLRFVPDEEVPVQMAAADLLVLPFAQSLTSGSVHLAQDYGLPVLASRLPGTAGLPNVTYVDGTAPDVLGKGIMAALSSEATRSSTMGTIPWPSIAELHKEVFSSMLSSSNQTELT